MLVSIPMHPEVGHPIVPHNPIDSQVGRVPMAMPSHVSICQYTVALLFMVFQHRSS